MRFSPTEAILGLNDYGVGIWRLSLEQIEATVADHLGRGRVPGNQPGPCFSRQRALAEFAQLLPDRSASLTYAPTNSRQVFVTVQGVSYQARSGAAGAKIAEPGSV